MTAEGTIITQVTSLIAALSIPFLGYLTYLNGRRIKRVDQKVDTVNGRSIGVLTELSEGRRIRRDIKPEFRTVREQSYVNLLEQVEREGSWHEQAEDIKLINQGESPEGPGSAQG